MRVTVTVDVPDHALNYYRWRDEDRSLTDVQIVTDWIEGYVENTEDLMRLDSVVEDELLDWTCE